MPKQPEPLRLATECAEADALAMASIQAIVIVLMREAVTQANTPRAERLRSIYDTAEAVRRRAVARKNF